MIARAVRAVSSLLVLGVAVGVAVSAPAPAQEASAAPARLALVIANTDYEADGWALHAPADDAALIADALRATGFEVEVRLDADREAMDAVLDAFGARLRAAGGAMGFFFYAGHGVTQDGVNYLLPVDARPEGADLPAQAPYVGRVLQAMKREGAGADFVVLDASWMHPPWRAEAPDEADGEDEEGETPPGLTAIARTPGVLVAFAAAPGARVNDTADEGDASAFAHALADALQVRGLPAHRAFERAAREVAAVSGFRQTPWIADALEGDAVFFAGPPAASDFQARVRETLRWDHARRTDAVEDYRAYLAAHRDGRYAGEALARLAKLVASAKPPAVVMEETYAGLANADEEADEARTELASSSPQALSRSIAALDAIEPEDAEPPPPPAWRVVDPEDLLVLDTTRGRILIETYPELAPLSGARVRELAREGFYDNAAFYRVVDGFAAQGGDPAGAATHAMGETIPREFLTPGPIASTPVAIADRDRGRVGVYAQGDIAFGLHDGAPMGRRTSADGAPGEAEAWITHCPGVASSARVGEGAPADTEFFLMRGEAPGLDMQRTPWGRVVDGLDVVYELAVGDPQTPGFAPDFMTRVRVAADLPAGARPRVEMLNEAGPDFADFLASLRRELGRAPRVCEIRLPARAELGAAR